LIVALQYGKVAPFPFLIICVLMIFISLAGQIRDQNSYISSNILLQISSLLFIAFLI